MSSKSPKTSPTPKHICIDFEGEARKKDKSIPQPALLGALVPKLNQASKSYYLWLLKPELAPMARSAWLPGSSKLRVVCSFAEAIQDVVHLAEQRNCKILSYSIHEETIVNSQLSPTDPIRIAFHQRFFNIKPKANALRNRRNLKTPDRSLDSLMKALAPINRLPPAPRGGAAKACRRLQRTGQRSKWWRSWTKQEKEIAKQLLLYNKGDCTAVWRLMNRVIANYRIPELD